jgi:transcriptional regulator with XRE-family HTH domain
MAKPATRTPLRCLSAIFGSWRRDRANSQRVTHIPPGHWASEFASVGWTGGRRNTPWPTGWDAGTRASPRGKGTSPCRWLPAGRRSRRCSARAWSPEQDGLPGRARTARLRLGLTQERLAKAAGLDIRTIRNTEGGSHPPSRATLWKLSAVLGDLVRAEAGVHPIKSSGSRVGRETAPPAESRFGPPWCADAVPETPRSCGLGANPRQRRAGLSNPGERRTAKL